MTKEFNVIIERDEEGYYVASACEGIIIFK